MSIASLDLLRAGVTTGFRLLGLDLGEKTIGLALSDTSLTVATPLETLKRSKFMADAANIVEIAKQYNVGGFIIGVPINMDGSEGRAAQSARAFARNFSGCTSLPIALWDERLSTMAVTRILLDANASRRRRAQVVDKLAAAYILQGALDRLKHIEQTASP